MISKSKIKFIQSLHRKKNRKQEKLFLIEGDKMAREALNYAGIREVYALQSWIDKNQAVLRSIETQVAVVSERELKAISTLKTPNQVLLVAQQPEANEIDSSIEGYCLYLDQIQDPGNMGTILRTADWYGISRVFCSQGCADVYNPKVVQASMGAILRIPVDYCSLSVLTNLHPDLVVYGTLLEGENLYELKPEENGLIVIGNEGKGISSENIELLQHGVTIPRGKGGKAESLNAAVATGIICAYFCTQR